MQLNATHLLHIRVALYFYNCTNVTMYNVEVSNSSQAIGVVMYDTDGSVNVTNSTFWNNTVDDKHPGGGGFAVEFTYCVPGDNTCNNSHYDSNKHKKNKMAVYNFVNCKFKFNEARGQPSTKFAGSLILVSNSTHQAIGRGGGLSIYFKGNATDNSVHIADCHFLRNHAVWGGGLLIEMDDNTINNNVIVSGSEFVHNHAFFSKDFGTGGGGLHIAITTYFWNDYYKENNFTGSTVLVENCKFVENHGLEGGAISFSIAHQGRSHSTQLTNITVSMCTFESNYARLGSAVGVFLLPLFYQGFLSQVVFEDCEFQNNSIMYTNRSMHVSGMGTLYISEVPVLLRGDIVFEENIGSAICVVGTQIDFMGASATFTNNEGTNGGAIALLGAASILAGPKTHLIFVGNYASQHGGAIFNRYISKENNINCFIRYSEPFLAPKDWNMSMYFSQNKAKNFGNSIYSTAILPCSWNALSSEGVADIKMIFCWNENWHYHDSKCTDEIYTEPRNFSLRNHQPLSSIIKVFPGHGFLLPLDAWDDLGHNVTSTTVYSATTNNSAISDVESRYTYIAHNFLGITGEPGYNAKLVMETTYSRTMHVELNLKIQECPPGFVWSVDEFKVDPTDNVSLVGNNVRSQIACKCVEGLDYRSYLKCLSQDFHSQVESRFWLGPPNDNSADYVLGHFPIKYSHAAQHKTDYLDLPNDTSLLDKTMCGDQHRTGVLCGKCISGYAAAINSPSYHCTTCNIPTSHKIGYLFAYIALTYIPILLLFLAIICFNFKLTSSAATGFVLYAQMISSGIFDITAGKASYLRVGQVPDIMQSIYSAIYGIFNLNSFSYLMSPFCINSSFTALDVIALDYATAAFPLVVIGVIYVAYLCRSRCQVIPESSESLYSPVSDANDTASSNADGPDEERTPKNTLVHAFVGFMFLSYTKFSISSMSTMIMSELFYANGTTAGSRVYFAGHLSFSDRNFLFPYGLLAIIIFIFIVTLPPLLLLGPIQFIDWLMEKRGFGFLRKLWPSIIIHTFLDTFQGYYKPNRRFFAGVYFLFRFVMFLSLCFTNTLIQQYVVQQVAVTVLMFLVLVFRPYKREFFNYVDALLFLDLAILNALATYILANKATFFPMVIYAFECILVWLPLFYMVGYLIWNRLRKKKSYDRFKIRVTNLMKSLASPLPPEEQPLINPSVDPHRTDKFYDSLNTTGDAEEDLLQRAERNYHAQTANIETVSPTRPGEVHTTFVSVPRLRHGHRPLTIEEELTKHDSGTGGSSEMDTKDSNND